MFAFFGLSLWTRGRLFFGWPYFWGFPHWVGIVIFFMVMRFIFMPFRMSQWHGYGYGYGPYAHPHYGWVAMWNGLAWFAMMMFGIRLAYHYIPSSTISSEASRPLSCLLTAVSAFDGFLPNSFGIRISACQIPLIANGVSS